MILTGRAPQTRVPKMRGIAGVSTTEDANIADVSATDASAADASAGKEKPA